MIVYAEREERVSTRAFLADLLASPDATDRLIRFGQFEAGVADALCPEVDSLPPVLLAIRRAAVSGDYLPVQNLALPDEIHVRPPEGFAYYALYPELYQRAAERFAEECRPERPLTIGVRSIGTTLSAVVVRTVGGDTFTIRPRGHPFDRKLAVTAELQCKIRAADWVLVVDEGPGLSGSSFLSVVRAATEAGVPSSRVVLFPSHDADPDSFKSEEARRLWPLLRRYVEPFQKERYVPEDTVNLSGGMWRAYCGVNVEVVPFLERRKYLDVGEQVLWKFAGLGSYGQRRLKRARMLERFTPPVLGLENAFLRTRWVGGRQAESADDELINVIARYLAHLRCECTTDSRTDTSSLAEMIRVNTGHAVRDPGFEEVRIAVDGRMLPHEWIRTANGWLKTDALDHHDDHLFPGCQDVAWDIAGAAVEFGVPVETIAERYLKLQRDPTLTLRLPFYIQAYSAFRLGYCRMFGLQDSASRYELAISSPV